MSKKESIGTDEDFYFGIYKFETECFENSTSLGISSYFVKYGNLSTLLQQTLMLGGANGIRGCNAVKIKKGYKQLDIRSPREFENYEND